MGTPHPEIDAASLNRAVAELAKRLDVVEGRLGIVPNPVDVKAAAERTEPPAAGSPSTAGVAGESILSVAKRMRAAVEFQRGAAAGAAPVAPFENAGVGTLSEAATPGAARPRPMAKSAEDGAVRDSFAIERFVGTKLYAAVGAIVVVVGLGLFLKLGVDRGWFSMPPAFRCLSAAGFGVALIGVGEVLRRRINAIAAAGVTAAGLGSVYGATYAAYGLYGLIGPQVAFVLLVGAVVMGIGLGLRARLPFVSAVALIGGYLAPLLLSRAGGPLLVLPLYLVGLLVVATMLPAIRAGGFGVLRTIAWWGTVLLGTLWLLKLNGNEAWAGIGFICVVWAVVHGELVWSTRGGRELRGDLATETPRAGSARGAFARSWQQLRPISSSFSLTAWSVVLHALMLRKLSLGEPWMASAGMMLATSVLPLMLVGHLRPLLDRPRSDAERLGAALLVQSAALLLGTIALGLGGWLQIASWIVLGAAAITAGRWLGARALDVYGVICLALGMLRLFVFDRVIGVTPVGPAIDVFGLQLSRWTLAVAGSAAVGIASGFVIRRGSAAWHSVGHAVISVSLFSLWLGTIWGSRSEAAVVTVSYGVSIASTALGAKLESRWLRSTGAALAVLGSLVAIGSRWWEGTETVIRGVGLVWSSGMAAVLVGGAAWGAAAFGLVRSAGRIDRVAAGIASWIAVAHAMVAFVHAEASPAAVLTSWAGVAAGLCIWLQGKRAAPALRWDWCATGVLGFAAVCWAAKFVGRGWDASAAPALLHPGLISAVAIGAAGLWVARIRRRFASGVTWSGWSSSGLIVSGVVLLMLAATSLEVGRVAGMMAEDPTVRGAAVSVWLGIAATGLVVAGFARAIPLVRHAGLALLAVAGVKAVFFDLSEVSTIWRIVSFVGLGLLMIGVSVLYSRIAARVEPSGESGAA